MKTISCKDAVMYLLKKEEGKLSPREQLKLWHHLWICRLCRVFSAQSKMMNRLLSQGHMHQHALSEEEKETIIRRVLDNDEK